MGKCGELVSFAMAAAAEAVRGGELESERANRCATRANGWCDGRAIDMA